MLQACFCFGLLFWKLEAIEDPPQFAMPDFSLYHTKWAASAVVLLNCNENATLLSTCNLGAMPTSWSAYLSIHGWRRDQVFEEIENLVRANGQIMKVRKTPSNGQASMEFLPHVKESSRWACRPNYFYVA